MLQPTSTAGGEMAAGRRMSRHEVTVLNGLGGVASSASFFEAYQEAIAGERQWYINGLTVMLSDAVPAMADVQNVDLALPTD